ncbi:hypothetical protein DPEC_G00139000, partial [Dallia pectoralis]
MQREDKPSLLLTFHTETKQESLDSDCNSGAQCGLVDSEMASVELEDCSPTLGLNVNIKDDVKHNIGESISKDDVVDVDTLFISAEQPQEDHKEKKSYCCSRCGRSFLSRSLLKIHMNIHTGVKPYPRSDCGKSFSQVGSLKAHQHIHTGEKPYTCYDCGKDFSTS